MPNPPNDTLTFSDNVGGYKAGENVSGCFIEKVFDVTLSNGYPLGGYSLTPSRYGQIGLKTIIGVVNMGGNPNVVSYPNIAIYQPTTQKLGIAGATFGEDLSALVLRLKFVGRS